MIKIFVVTTLAICGLILLILPKDKLVDKNKIKQEQDPEKLAKQYRMLGVIFLALSVVFFFTM